MSASENFVTCSNFDVLHILAISNLLNPSMDTKRQLFCYSVVLLKKLGWISSADSVVLAGFLPLTEFEFSGFRQMVNVFPIFTFFSHARVHMMPSKKSLHRSFLWYSAWTSFENKNFSVEGFFSFDISIFKQSQTLFCGQLYFSAAGVSRQVFKIIFHDRVIFLFQIRICNCFGDQVIKFKQVSGGSRSVFNFVRCNLWYF